MEAYVGMDTPWGAADSVTKVAEGIYIVSTPSHGGFRLSPERNQQIPAAFRRKDRWYEEDVDALIVMHTFFDLCREHYRDLTRESLERHLKDWRPDEYEKAFGVKLMAKDSHILRRREVQAEHKDDLIVVTAWGDWHPSVPSGMIGVAATRGGARRYAANEVRYFLIPAGEYRAVPFGEFVVDPTKYQEWPEGRDA